MNRHFTSIELLVFWLMLILVPIIVVGWGWKSFLDHQTMYRQQQIERDLVNEAWYYQTDLQPTKAIDRQLKAVHDEFGFGEQTTPEKRRRFDSIDRAFFDEFLAAVEKRVGCRPLCVVLASGMRNGATIVGWNRAYAPTREKLRALRDCLRNWIDEHWRIWPSPQADRIGLSINRRFRTLFGADANLTSTSEFATEFVTHFRGFGGGFIVCGHGPRLNHDQKHPRLGHFLLVFHEHELNLQTLLKSCRTPFTPHMRRRIRWIRPTALPYLRRDATGVVYAEALRLSRTQRQLIRHGKTKYPGKVPVAEVSLPLQYCVAYEANLSWVIGLLQTAWFLAGTLLIISLAVHGIPVALGISARLAWGFLLALFPALAGICLLMSGWLFMRDGLQPSLAITEVDRTFDRIDDQLKAGILAKSREAQEMKRELLNLQHLGDEQAVAKIESWFEKTAFDMVFILYSSGREVFWNKTKVRSDPGMIKLFRHLMRDFFQTKSAGRESTADSLLAKTMTEQFVDAEKMARFLERGESLSRTPMGSLNQTVIPLYLRDPASGKLLAMVFLKGFMHFTDQHMDELLEQFGRDPDIGNGFERRSFAYSYYNPVYPSINDRSFPRGNDPYEEWKSLQPFAKRALNENVERIEQKARSDDKREWVRTRFLEATFFIAIGCVTEEAWNRLRPMLWGLVLVFLLALSFWGMQRETGRILAGPLDVLQEALRAAASGNFQWQLKLSPHDEFGATGGVFNHMAEKLIEREKMSRFVSEDILDRVSGGEEAAIQPGQGEQVETTVLVSDIRSFTTLSEQYAADQMVEMLNDYFTAMEDGIAREKGVIVSYIGDAIVAHFPQREGLDDCAVRAARAAWAMRQALIMLNRQRQSTGRFAVRTGIGLATGTLVSGVAGSAHGRLTQILLGAPFESATTLEVASKRAQASGIMIDTETARRCQGFYETRGLPNEPEVIEIVTTRTADRS